MIEEIKKYIQEEKVYIEEVVTNVEVIAIDKLFYILDKYNNQPDYKKMWEELKEEIMKKEKLYDRCIEALFLPNESNKSLELKQNYGKGFHFGSKLTNGYIDKIMQELEQKHNLDKE